MLTGEISKYHLVFAAATIFAPFAEMPGIPHIGPDANYLNDCNPPAFSN
jgi:hypothetical protein